MLYVIAYDIHDDKRRYRVVKILEGVGDRVQYSVFEAFLSESQLKRIQDRLQSVIDPFIDSVRFYSMGVKYNGRITVVGWGMKPESLEYTLI